MRGCRKRAPLLLELSMMVLGGLRVFRPGRSLHAQDPERTTNQFRLSVGDLDYLLTVITS